MIATAMEYTGSLHYLQVFISDKASNIYAYVLRAHHSVGSKAAPVRPRMSKWDDSGKMAIVP